MKREQFQIHAGDGLCLEIRPPECGIVIFGASGDLSQRKLLPALFELFERKLMPPRFYILGAGRTPYQDDSFREEVRRSLVAAFPSTAKSRVAPFLKKCFYLTGDYGDPAFYQSLGNRLDDLEASREWIGNRLFYLATPPRLICPIVCRLGDAGLVRTPPPDGRWTRVVIEKPFGRDLESARELDRRLDEFLAESQLYRIDHYLGKETVQNILMLRFANTVFEPVWNRSYIDHVQITVSESMGVGHRAGYFDHNGLFRDMFQSHMLQLLALTAMEPPPSFGAERIRDERVQVLHSIRRFPKDGLSDWVVRGQYGPGEIEGEKVPGYREEEGVEPDSLTETFVAAKVMIDNWRWRGVPFYLRAGKRLARKRTEIAVIFKPVPHSMFTPLSPAELSPNVLLMTIQPQEGMSLKIQVKRPGPKVCLTSMGMDVSYREAMGGDPPNAYERLLLDCMLGDQTLFWRQDGIEEAWSLVTPVLKAWEEDKTGRMAGRLYPYPAGSSGPKAADELPAGDGRSWREL